MLTWIIGNMATIVVSVVLFLVVAAIIAGMVRDKRKGKSACGCGCAGCSAGNCCAMNGACHSEK